MNPNNYTGPIININVTFMKMNVESVLLSMFLFIFN